MKTAAYIIGGALALAALGIGVPFYQAAVSKVTVSPRVQTEARTTARALGNTERFYDLAAVFEVRVAQVADAQTQLQNTVDPEERARLSVELSGARAICREVAADYNADAIKTTRADLRDARLPVELNAARCAEETQ